MTQTLLEAEGAELDEVVRVVTLGAPEIGARGTRTDDDHRLIAVVHVRDAISRYRRLLDTPEYQGMAPSRHLRQVAALMGVETTDLERDRSLSERIVAVAVEWLRLAVKSPAPLAEWDLDQRTAFVQHARLMGWPVTQPVTQSGTPETLRVHTPRGTLCFDERPRRVVLTDALGNHLVLVGGYRSWCGEAHRS